MKSGHESSEDFSNVLEYMNNDYEHRSESVDEIELSSSGPESCSNSITEDECYSIGHYILSDKIQIPPPTIVRKRETNYDGTSILDLRYLTPTPTKYYNQLHENMKIIKDICDPDLSHNVKK